MAEQTGIGWTDHTFNPWWGCVKVSEGCRDCYAIDVAERYEGSDLWGPNHRLRLASEGYWAGPVRWNQHSEQAALTGKGLGRRHRIFCLSMGDVFEERPDLEPHRRRLFALIAATPWLDWQLLTKRPEFARDWLRRYFENYWYRVDRDDRPEPLAWTSRDGIGWGVHPNVWVGVSIETTRWTWRADVLREIPAPVRFISAEPLLGSLYTVVPPREVAATLKTDAELEEGVDDFVVGPRRPLDLSGIDWLIVGGESGGRDARPMRPEWARELRDACKGLAARRRRDLLVSDPVSAERLTDADLADEHWKPSPGPALYFKQWGSHDADGVYRSPTPKAGGKVLDGVEWCEFPETAAAGQLALA